MSLFTFWAGVVVWSLFGLGYLIGTEYEARQRWAEWEREQQRKRGRS